MKNLYLTTDLRQRQKQTSSTRKNAWHDLTLITTTVANFVGTGSFLIRHSKGQINISPTKEIQRLLLIKYWSLIFIVAPCIL